MSFELIIGFLLVLLGIASLIGRIFKIKKLFWKLEKMQATWGKQAGSVIHFIGYVLAPIALGIVLIIKNI